MSDQGVLYLFVFLMKCCSLFSNIAKNAILLSSHERQIPVTEVNQNFSLTTLKNTNTQHLYSLHRTP